MSEQLVLEIPGWPSLTVEPTPAMSRGEQRIFQCSWCGCVVVVPSSAFLPLAACPARHEEPTSWWEQRLPVAGLHPPPVPPTEEQVEYAEATPTEEQVEYAEATTHRHQHEHEGTR